MNTRVGNRETKWNEGNSAWLKREGWMTIKEADTTVILILNIALMKRDLANPVSRTNLHKP